MAEGFLQLVADIGGTNARFGLVRTTGVPEAVRRLPLAEYERFEDAVEIYLTIENQTVGSLTGMAIAAAGPVQAGTVSMTNANWHLDQAALSARFGGIPVRLMNDLAAVAYALPSLSDRDLIEVVGKKPSSEPAPLLALNVGTGLGASIAIPAGGAWAIQATEAGHMRLGAIGQQDLKNFGDLETFEDLLAGPGWQRFQRRQGHLPPGALADLYSRVLGRFAGDLVLATGAWGGVYFCGGVMNNWDELVDPMVLLKSFADHGPMAALLETVPIYRITAEDPALRGLATVILPAFG